MFSANIRLNFNITFCNYGKSIILYVLHVKKKSQIGTLYINNIVLLVDIALVIIELMVLYLLQVLKC